jgi:hypothetical protein
MEVGPLTESPGSPCLVLVTNRVCPHAELYKPKHKGPEQQDPYDAVSRARMERTARFWESIIQKGRQCSLNQCFCAEYDLSDWQKCPILKLSKNTKIGETS